MNRILSANYEEIGTRRALDTLGEFELDTSLDHALDSVVGGRGGAGKMEEVKVTKDGMTMGGTRRITTEQGRMGKALKKGGLRKEVESRMAEGSRSFLAAFSEVNDVRSVLPLPSLPLNRPFLRHHTNTGSNSDSSQC